MEPGDALDMAFTAQSPEDIAWLGPGKLVELVVRVHLPAFEKVQDFIDRGEQALRNLRLAFALAAYRGDRGLYPKDLADLTPAFVAAVPGDLFSGKPLVYKPRKSGYLLYSVGPNGKDDRGKTYGDEPFGSDDIVVRVPMK